MKITQIVSGGQTGVDRAALDVAIEMDIPHGGWCPKGRLAEDGTISSRYRLKEMDSQDYAARTEQNVIDSDGTLLLFTGAMTGGTALTWKLAKKHHRPRLALDLDHAETPSNVQLLLQWITEHNIGVINVAGPRESNCPGIGQRAADLLERALKDVSADEC